MRKENKIIIYRPDGEIEFENCTKIKFLDSGAISFYDGANKDLVATTHIFKGDWEFIEYQGE